MASPKNSKWFLEALGPDEAHLHGIKSVLFSKQTAFQHIEVIELGDYGRALVLDGKVQSTEKDEFIYHETLVHPALLAHPDPRRVLIIGGGEGATLREVLRHTSVTQAVMVDVDQEVIEVSRSLLPQFHGGAFDDARTQLVIDDARHWLETHDEVFDAIIIDLSDPIEEGPCYRLYTQEFYRLITQRLSEAGVIALQSGTVAVHDLLNFSAIHRTLRTAFPTVWPYTANVPCFGLPWGFQLASKQNLGSPPSGVEYEQRIVRRVPGQLRYLTGALCAAQFVLPRYLQSRIECEHRVIADDAPLYIYR
jgi:spermidine synthase